MANADGLQNGAGAAGEMDGWWQRTRGGQG